METDNIYGLNWPNTKTGELAIVKCSPFMIGKANNFATRLCDNNNVWDKIDVTNCESFQYSLLLLEVHHYNYYCYYYAHVVSTLIHT